MGAEHAAIYADMPDVKVAGVCARDLERARSVADVCGARAFVDANELIQWGAIDAVDVCLPSAIHCRYVMSSLSHAKHVFCETPMALRLDEAKQMRHAARHANRLLQVGLLMRSAAPYDHIKSVVASGRHGRLLSLLCYRLGSYLRQDAPDQKFHYSDPSTELMTFDFDFANWLLGSPVRLFATSTRLAGGGPGEISAVVSYNDNQQATIIGSGLMPDGYPFSVGFRALFERGLFELHNVFRNGPPQIRFTVADDAGGSRDVEVHGRSPYRVELQRFVDCIRGQGDPELLDAERAIEALRMSVATQRSIEELRAIEFVEVS